MIGKGNWKAINSINHVFVVTEKNEAIADCYNNKDNADLIAEAKEMLTMLREVKKYEDDLQNLPADLVNDIKKLVDKFKPKKK